MAASPGPLKWMPPFPEELRSTRDSARAATLTSSSWPPGSGFPYRRKRKPADAPGLNWFQDQGMDCLPPRCRKTSLPKSSGKQ